MRNPSRFFAVACICAVPWAALGGDGVIGDREWRTLTEGKTVYYQKDGKPLGREYYTPGQNFLTFEAPDGHCIDGVWAFADGQFCFWYGDSFQCYAHIRRNGKIFTLSDTSNSEQQVERIVDEPLTCTSG